tara:strand:- start:145 stop:282 length:138 start_codon:yes stop_codon:yes gene_type:complete
MGFIFGIVIASLLIFFHAEIKELAVESGLIDFLINWLQSLNVKNE